MATFNSSIYNSMIGTAGASMNVGTNLNRDIQGQQRNALIGYTTLGTEVTGNTLALMYLPKGAKLLPQDSNYTITATLGTGVTVRVGDSATANRWSGTIDVSAGGFFPFTNTLGSELEPVAVTADYPTLTTNLVQLTFVAITSITAGKRIFILVSYILP